jgi:hypothetical protein
MTLYDDANHLIDRAYADGLVAGRAEVLEALAALLDKYASPGATAPEASPGTARRDALPVPPTTHGLNGSGQGVRLRRTRRTLTPTQRRILDFINSHPDGVTGNDIRQSTGSSPSHAYELARRRKVRRTSDPKPHTQGKPWVRFFPINTQEPALHDEAQQP